MFTCELIFMKFLAIGRRVIEKESILILPKVFLARCQSSLSIAFLPKISPLFFFPTLPFSIVFIERQYTIMKEAFGFKTSKNSVASSVKW